MLITSHHSLAAGTAPKKVKTIYIEEMESKCGAQRHTHMPCITRWEKQGEGHWCVGAIPVRCMLGKVVFFSVS